MVTLTTPFDRTTHYLRVVAVAIAATLAGAACDDIRRVSLTATVQRHGVSHTLRAKVFIRSTMHGSES